MDVKDIGALALTLGVAGIIISFTLLMQSKIQIQTCPSNSTWGEGWNNSARFTGGIGANKITNDYSGCCGFINGSAKSQGKDCNSWSYSAAFNSTGGAIEGVAIFSVWFVLIVLAVVFAIIIGIIVKYIGGGSGQVQVV